MHVVEMPTALAKVGIASVPTYTLHAARCNKKGPHAALCTNVAEPPPPATPTVPTQLGRASVPLCSAPGVTLFSALLCVSELPGALWLPLPQPLFCLQPQPQPPLTRSRSSTVNVRMLTSGLFMQDGYVETPIASTRKMYHAPFNYAR